MFPYRAPQLDLFQNIAAVFTSGVLVLKRKHNQNAHLARCYFICSVRDLCFLVATCAPVLIDSKDRGLGYTMVDLIVHIGNHHVGGVYVRCCR